MENRSELNEIINQDQIKTILQQFQGERQLIELKFYLITFKEELKEFGIEPTQLAWQIYRTNLKPNKR